jgi:hypothetical protein
MEYEEFQADFEQRDRRIIELETQLRRKREEGSKKRPEETSQEFSRST